MKNIIFLLSMCDGHVLLKVKKILATFIESDPKAFFSIATTPTCWGGCDSIPWIDPLYPYLIMLRAKQSGIKYHF